MVVLFVLLLVVCGVGAVVGVDVVLIGVFDADGGDVCVVVVVGVVVVCVAASLS